MLFHFVESLDSRRRLAFPLSDAVFGGVKRQIVQARIHHSHSENYRHYYIIDSRLMNSADMQCRMQSEAVVTVITTSFNIKWSGHSAQHLSSPLDDCSNREYQEGA